MADQRATPRRQRWAVAAATGAGGCLAGLTVGLMIGNIASVLDSPAFAAVIQLGTAGGSSSTVSASVAKGALGGAMPAGAIPGALAGFWLVDAVGRTRSLLCASVLLLVGNCAAAAAGVCAPGLALALVGGGRAFTGVGTGLASAAAPPFTSEVAPLELRGALGAAYQLALMVGVFLGQLCGLATGGDLWALSLGAPVPAALLLAVAAVWLPESPRWLLLRGRPPSDAAAALGRLRVPGADVGSEVAEIIASLPSPHRGTASRGGGARWTWGATFATLICLLQTGSGVDIFTTYGPEVYVAAGMAADSRFVAQLALGVTGVTATALAVSLVERAGRRALIVNGALGCSLTLTALFLVLGRGWGGDTGLTLVLPLCVTFYALYSLSWGPLAFLIVTEMVPTELLARCMAVSVVANFISDFLVIAAWPVLSDAVGQGAAFGASAQAFILGPIKRWNVSVGTF